MRPRTFGVEEELLLVDPESGAPRPICDAVIRFARENGGPPPAPAGDAELLEPELQRQQLETLTPPCVSLDELADHVRGGRRAASAAAAGAGAAVAALATCPVEVHPSLTPSLRYRRMADAYGLTADEQLTCGCHVHVGIGSPDEGVAVLDRIRPWLPPLLAISANSPFWQGNDSGYASWRQQVWWRWPSSGPTQLFGSAEHYRATVDALLGTGALLDEGMVYFDARLSRRYPTVEVRVADVCLRASDTVLVAALVRALVDTAAREWRADRPPDPVRTDLLRLAMWRASRSGLEGDLVHPVTRRAAPARAVIGALLDHVRPALERYGDLKTTERLLAQVAEEGTGACRQRRVHKEKGSVAEVVSDAVRRTTTS
ncbi:carboxylate-amine ligase [Actinomadura rugatobispora]|uniref:Putative glutamate--cysteine ligase 2 n=1 Tax=Actinomadura rugatobispora TaxID=1994 RepID=A0ABW1AFT2_9ACTN|nr:glutamate--cysteine ligase [Actinomadura rugatobispora]